MNLSLSRSNSSFSLSAMILAQPNNLTLLSRQKIRSSRPLGNDAYACSKKQISIQASHNYDDSNESVARIKERFGKVELSVSAYDTAWVAMVPSRDHSNHSCFPQCLDWIMNNQHPNGSWCLQSSPLKDSLSSTLACVLALQKWKVGQQLVAKGLDFIGSNRLALQEKHQSPIGFDIIFPFMVSLANDLDLNVPVDSTLLNSMFLNRDIEIRRNKTNLGYIAEGLGEFCDWKELMINHKRSNGSLFNSPATTAAGLLHLHDDTSYDYLQLVLKQNLNTVPTVYPFNIYTRLCMVDTIERLGISRYFKNEIKSVLEETYRGWEEKNEEIWLDVSCCAMALRLLKMNGYKVASDALTKFRDKDYIFNSASTQFANTNTVLELYKASEITSILQGDPTLEKMHGWTRTFLEEQLLNQQFCEEWLQDEVEYTLEYSVNSLDRLKHRRSIEIYDCEKLRMLKTSYRCLNVDNKDMQTFSQQDFNKCQDIFRDELKEIEKWIKERELDSLKFNLHVMKIQFFQAASLFFAPELAYARILYSKHGVFAVIVDDILDIDGSREELANLLELMKKWDEHETVGYYSKRNEIIFSAFYDMINKDAVEGYIVQGRCIKQHLIDTWIDFLSADLKECGWLNNQQTPTLDEYLLNGAKSIAAELYYLSFFFLGTKLSKHAVESNVYTSLVHICDILSRLFNDYAGAQLEVGQKTLNYCWLLVNDDRSKCSTVEEAKAELLKMIERVRREELLLTIEADEENNVVPKEIKEAFYYAYKLNVYLYGSGNDELRTPVAAVGDIKALMYDPVKLKTPKSSAISSK